MKRKKANSAAGFFTVSQAVLFCLLLPAAGALRPPLSWAQAVTSPPAEEKSLAVIVPGNLPWTDTGLEVVEGQGIVFRAQGEISLQKGNPEAECGPDGYDLQTVQQPLPENNLGALIGKVVISVTITVDEKTGEEERQEAAQAFFIGSGNLVEMPASGRLYLGINENITGDNSGEFKVTVASAQKTGR